MAIETLEQALEMYEKYKKVQHAYNHALGVLYQDAVTAAPSGSYVPRNITMEVLSEVTYELATKPENGEMIRVLEENRDSLSPQLQREVEVLRKEYDRFHRIPQEEYVEYSVLCNEAANMWEKAKNESDFSIFAPYLEKIVSFNKKFAGYYNPQMEPYDALLNEFEEGLTQETLDAFFAELRSAIVPLLGKVQKAQQIDTDFLNGTFSADVQKKYATLLMDVLGLDRERCTLAESEHPFTSNFTNKDVRITTHYYEKMPIFSMYSVIHEGGHALYELGADDCYNYTPIAGGASMSIHESQSRFYENLIGRSQAFIHHVFPKFRELFPEQMENVTEEMFYRAVNKVEPSLIRTEADELTYCLHIMVRYEIEKMLIAGTLKVEDVPAKWNALYRDYLGIEVPDDRSGCLQDSHWSGGMLGYFPSYALGSAYASQIFEKMQEELGDVYAEVAQGNISGVTAWLREHIHRHAAFYKPTQLLERVVGKFDPKYYTEYLERKYTKLYGIEK